MMVMRMVMLFMQKMPMLVSDHGSDTDEDEVEDPKLVQEEKKRSEQSTNNLISRNYNLPVILCKSSAKLAPKVLHALKKPESSYISPEVTKLVE